MVEAPDIGLVVHWDKGTRVYVKVDPRWKDKVSSYRRIFNIEAVNLDIFRPKGYVAIIMITMPTISKPPRVG